MGRILPPSRLTAVSSALLLLCVGAMPAAAQRGATQSPEATVSPLVGATVGIVLTLLIGGALIGLGREYTDRTTRYALDNPGQSFVYGFVISIVAGLVIGVLAITGIGLVVAIPAALVLAVYGVIGYLTAGRAVSDNWGVALVVAAAVGGIAGGVPILGGLLGLVVSSIGIGAGYLAPEEDQSVRRRSRSSSIPQNQESSGQSPPRR